METRNNLNGRFVTGGEGLLSRSERARLAATAVGVAGVGGSGVLLSEQLVRLGINHLHLVDPAYIELPNRGGHPGRMVCGATTNMLKQMVDQIRRIRPEAEILVEKKAIRSQDDAAKFSERCDITVDAMDFRLFRESIFLQRAARQKGSFYLLVGAIGFGAQVVIFNPFGITLEEYYYLPADLNLTEISDLHVGPERFFPEIPSYLHDKISLIYEAIYGNRPMPASSVGLSLASILAAAEVANIILKKRETGAAPGFIYMDLMDRRLIVRSISHKGV